MGKSLFMVAHYLLSAHTQDIHTLSTHDHCLLNDKRRLLTMTDISHSSTCLLMMDGPSSERLLALSAWEEGFSSSTCLQGLCYPLGHRPITCFAFLSSGSLAPLTHPLLPADLPRGSLLCCPFYWLLLRSLWGDDKEQQKGLLGVSYKVHSLTDVVPNLHFSMTF